MDANSSCGSLSEDSSTTKRNHAKRFKSRVSPSPSEIFVRNYWNFKQSGIPVRFIYYMNETWIGFTGEVFEKLKKGFVEGDLMMEISIEGSRFLFDFLRMWQIDLGTGKKKFISWIDVNKKSFFPKIFPIDDEDEVCRVVPKLGIDQIKRKRYESDSEAESSGESSSVVESNTQKKPRIKKSAVFDKSNWKNVEILKEDDKSYKDVKNIFVSGLKKIDQSVNITSICRCLHKGPAENLRMQMFLKQMELTKASRGVSNLKLAWHGTTSEGVANVLSHGFGLPSLISGSQPYGVGIYLSPGQSPETSVLVSETDHNGEKHALFCRVVMGNVEQVEGAGAGAGAEQFCPSSEQFDTGADDILNPKWYIVWSTHMNTHILPEYVVSYKTLEHRTPVPIPARTAASFLKKTIASVPVPKKTIASGLPFPELFDALKSSLSSSTFQELEHVFCIYKERKISKEEMIKRLRSIAGDTLLISTISRIRSMKS